MSYDLNVYLSRERMPTPEDWRSAITRAGFPALLDTEFDIDGFSGFLPCPVNGETSGFEYYPLNLMEDAEDPEAPVEFDFSIMFSIGTGRLERISALAAASVLASLTGGRLEDPQSDESHAGEDAVLWARPKIAELLTAQG
jgi:hypothetical protein